MKKNSESRNQLSFSRSPTLEARLRFGRRFAPAAPLPTAGGDAIAIAFIAASPKEYKSA
ncbi:hypothetical protein [Nostoc sp.]|uniref:hypothetical protein n=1 Tax=Nostoc sp. TaxID=1180 RepID=UPI002FFCF9F3